MIHKTSIKLQNKGQLSVHNGLWMAIYDFLSLFRCGWGGGGGGVLNTKQWGAQVFEVF